MPAESWLKPRRRIYLVRHAEVSYLDDLGRPADHQSVNLTADGRRQAELLGQELSGVAFDRVLTSDLPRCLETARLLLHDRSLTIESCPDLREIQPGKLEDLPAQSIEQMFAHSFGKHLTLESQFLMGESFGALLDRVLSCFSKVLVEPGWRHLLMVAHGGVNRALLAHALGLGVSAFGLFEQDPCCLNLIDVDDRGGYLVRLLNHTGYNAPKVGLELTTMERLFLDFKDKLKRDNLNA